MANKKVENKVEEEVKEENKEATTFEYKEEDVEVNVDPQEEKLNTLNNQYVRLQADFENYKKRNASLASQRYNDGVEAFASDILPVLDYLDLAIDAQKDDNQRKGIELTKKTFMDVLAKYNIEEIKALGEEFDPNFMEAVQSVDDEENSGKVINELKKGYKRNNQVLRHSIVIVAK